MMIITCWWAGHEVFRLEVRGHEVQHVIDYLEEKFKSGTFIHRTTGHTHDISVLNVDIMKDRHIVRLLSWKR